jgi:chromosome segregation ATPase
MEGVLNKLAAVEQKARELAGQYQELKDAYERLVNEHHELKQESKKKESELKELKKDITLHDVSTTALSEIGPDEAKKRVDELVREIDRCLAILDK